MDQTVLAKGGKKPDHIYNYRQQATSCCCDSSRREKCRDKKEHDYNEMNKYPKA